MSAGKGAVFASSSRLASLDLFRGFTIAAMILVNNQLGPGAYAQLRHADWDGLTFTDLVFPSFLWIAGVATTLSTANRLERGHTRGDLLRNALRRAAIIFAIGLLLNALWGFDVATLRIPGVLQRIALCYLAGTLIYLWTGPVGRIVSIGALCGAYWFAMAPAGYEMEANIGAQLDRLLMPGHLFTPVYDPEGLLTTLPAIGTFLFGVLAGDKLRTRKTPGVIAAWLAASGLGLIILGYALSPFQPINKALWTVPYTLITAGIASAVFGAAYWIADARGHRGAWTLPLTIFGVNAIGVYTFHSVIESAFNTFGPREAVSQPLAGALGMPNGSLLYGLLHVGICFGFAWLLWRRRIFLKV